MITPEVRILLDTVTNPDLHLAERRFALKDLALTIERNSDCADSQRTYEVLLPQPLLDAELTESEKSDILHSLCKQLEIEPSESGLLGELLWAIGKTDGSRSADALQVVLACALERNLSQSELRQAILSLEDLSYMVQDQKLIALSPLFNRLKSKVVASGDQGTLTAINGYFAKLSKRNLPGG